MKTYTQHNTTESRRGATSTRLSLGDGRTKQALFLVATVVCLLSCGRPTPPPDPEATVGQSLTDLALVPLGTTWDRLNQTDRRQCVPPATNFEFTNRLSARAFRLSSITEVESKLTASLGVGVKAGPVTADAKLALENTFKTTTTNEVYVIAVTFLEQTGGLTQPTLVPSSSCKPGTVEDFINACGTDQVGRVAHGGFAFLWVNAANLGGSLPLLREKLGSLTDAIDVNAVELLTDLDSIGVSFVVESNLGVPGGSGAVLKTTDILAFFESLTTQARARPLGSPGLPRVSTELTAARLDVIDACVGPTGMTEPQWACLHEQLIRLSDFAREEGPGLNLLQKYQEALGILERLRLEPDPFIFPATTQAVCDSVRPPGQGMPSPSKAAAVCAKNIYAYIAANYSECRVESQGKISQCLAAILAKPACDSREGVWPVECRLSEKCETLITASSSAPPPEDRGNRPTVPPGSKFRQNRTYFFESGTRAQTEILGQEPVSSTLCFLTAFGGLFDDDGDFVNVREGTTNWQVDFRTATGGADLTRFNNIRVECVDKSRFNRPFWTQGGIADVCFGPGKCRVSIPSTVLPAPRSNIQSYSALGGIGGRWQHWEDSFEIDTFAAPNETFYEFRAVSGDPKEARVNWFAADPAISHPSLSSTPPSAFSLEGGSAWAKTVADSVSPATPFVVLPVKTTEGICFLNGARGEFVRSEDMVMLMTLPTLNYALLVNSGWNTVDRRDVYARAQCVLYQ